MAAARRDPDLTAGLVRRFLQIGVLFAAQLAMLLLASGRPGWLWAWVYVGIYAVGTTVNARLLLKRSPETIVERGRAAGMAGWDKVVGGLWGIVFLLALPLTAGLDERFGWTGEMATALHLAGVLPFVLGFALFSWAMVENAFFVTVARVQKERGQTVCTSGPYRLVRHPGYLAAIIQGLAAPLLFGSAWALLPGCLAAALMALRTALEDRMLLRDLDGYPAYAARVRHRLLPGIW